MDQVLIGQDLLDREGNAIGKITDVIVDPATLEPEWITVKTGRFGGERLVPVSAVEASDGAVVAPFDKERVKDSPNPGQHTSPSEPEREALYAHYGLTVPRSGTDQLHESA